MSLYTLTIDLLANTGSFSGDMGKAARVTEKASRDIRRSLEEDVSASAQKAAKSVEGMQTTITRAMAGLGAGAVFGMFVRETVNAQNELAQLNAALKSTGEAAGFNSRQLSAMATQMAKSTTHSSGEIMRAQTRLLSYSGVVGEQFPRALQLAIDQSVRLGESLEQSAERVGKALEYPAEGVSSLTQQGFRFSDQQKALLKDLADTGRMAEAQAIVMGVMEESYEGAAAAARDTLGGALKSVTTSFEDLMGGGAESTGVRAATAAINTFANNLDVAAAALGGFAAVKATQSVIARTKAVQAATLAEQQSARQAVAAAQSLELRTRAALLDAQAEARRAQAIGGSIAIDAKAAQAKLEHRRATVLLAQAQQQAAAAAAGPLQRAGSAALGLFGGPWGLAGMVAATAAGWLLFRDNTNAASRALDSMNGTLDDSIQKYRELDRLRQAGVMAELKDQVADAAGEVEAEVGRLVRRVETLLMQGFTKGGQAYNLFPDDVREAARLYAVEVGEVQRQWKAGEITGYEYTEALQRQNEKLTQTEGAARALGDGLALQGGEVGAAVAKHQELADKLAVMSGKATAAEIAARNLAGAVRDVADAANVDFSGIDKMLDSMMEQANRRYSEAMLGKAGAAREALEQMLLKEGINPRSEEARERRARLAHIAELEAASDAAREAAKSSGREAKEAQAALERQAESIARYEKQAALAAATLAGPLQQAEESHRQRLAELDAELSKGNITQSAYNALKAEAADQLDRTNAALREQQQAPDALLGAMREEVELLGMIGPERELYRRGLQAERDMRDAINRANEAGAGINDEVAESLVRQARSWSVASVEIEEAAAAAEDWRYTVMGNVEGVADVFADLFSGQIKSTRDFFAELKDVWKRGWWDIVRMSMQESFVNPIQKALAGMMRGQGFAGAGQQPGMMLAGSGGMFGLGSGGLYGTAIGNGTAYGGAMHPAWGMSGYGGAGMGAPGAMGGGGGGFGGGMPSMNMLTGEFAGGMPYASAALGLYGLYYGATQRGNNALVSGVAGLSYGALGIAAGGAIAGGLGALGTGVGLAGAGAGAAAGSTAAMGSAASAIGGASWIPVVGWVLAALAAVDLVSGGRLFGTKYKPQSITQDIGIDSTGGMASAYVHETRKKSLFRGTAHRDRQIETTPEQREAAQDLYDAMEKVAQSAASQLGQESARIVAGSIRQVYNKHGELQSELSTVLGQTYEETFEDFASRLTSEQLIAAVGKLDSDASKIAQDWRHSAEVLAAGAEFFMSAASDARNGLDLWSGIGLQGLTDFVERMQMGEESLTQAYSRIAGLARDYGSFMADINTTLMTDGLNAYQQQALQVERTYRQQVKAANDYAKALGLSGTRAEDLAKIEELRAVSMGKLEAQMKAENDAFLGQLALSDLSTLRDDQKLAEAMQDFGDAVAGGDTQAAQAAAQAALGFGRNLYASGRDYQSLYDQITSQLRGMMPSEADLDMGDLADDIEAMQEGISRAVFELAARGERTVNENIRPALDQNNALLGQLLDEVRRQGGSADSARMHEALNGSSRHVVLR